MESFDFKRGSTFECAITLTDSNGDPVVIDPADMQAQLRDSSNVLLADLDITTDTPGTYLLSTDSDTSAWALGVAFCDIRATVGTKVYYSDTVDICIVRQITLEPEEP